jgi:hypothetical protein
LFTDNFQFPQAVGSLRKIRGLRSENAVIVRHTSAALSLQKKPFDRDFQGFSG